MELSSILMARVYTLFQTDELNPRNHLSPFDLTKSLVERYGFIKYPQEIKDYDYDKGVEYLIGKYDDGTLIGRVAIFTNGIAVETGASTADSERILEGMLAWSAGALGVTYKPSMIKRRGYLSQVMFTTDISLDSLNPILRPIAERITKRVTEGLSVTVPFETTGIVLGFDSLNTKYPIVPFEISRRVDVPFPDKRYFSQAPLPTEEHLQLLADFEAALKS